MCSQGKFTVPHMCKKGLEGSSKFDLQINWEDSKLTKNPSLRITTITSICNAQRCLVQGLFFSFLFSPLLFSDGSLASSLPSIPKKKRGHIINWQHFCKHYCSLCDVSFYILTTNLIIPGTKCGVFWNFFLRLLFKNWWMFFSWESATICSPTGPNNPTIWTSKEVLRSQFRMVVI